MRKLLQKKFALSEKGATDMIKAILACTVYNIALMLPAVPLYYLVSDLLGGGVSGRRVPFYLIGCVVCLALIFATTYLQYHATFFTTYLESGVRRIALAEKLRKLPLSFFGRRDLSDLTSSIMADCTTMEEASSHWIPQLISSLLSTALIAVGLFFFDWRMALAGLWVLPVAFAIVLFSAKVQRGLGNRQMKAKIACAEGIQECLEAVRDLKANNAEAEYLSGLDVKIKEVEKRAIFTELGLAVFVVSAQMVLKLGIATVALVGGILLARGTLSVLTFFLFLLLVSRLYDPMQASLANLAAVIGLHVQSERLNEILEHPIQSGAAQLTNQGCDIEFEGVTFAYNADAPVLRDVSFTARQGQVTALIGPSGGGKTTASRLAARFWDAAKGRITVGGMDVARIDPETLLSLYSIVFQEVTLFNNTILENIRIGRKDATDEEALAAGRLANCHEFADRLPGGWNTVIGENGSALSGGERQRISIARAFLKGAPIILLDEATASLDVENETLIQEALSRLIADKTVLLIAHRMRTVAAADKIVVLDGGTVTQQGPPAELLRQNGLYAHMVELQQKSSEWKM